MIVAVAQKWVDHRPEVDPLTGVVETDPRTSAASPADQAALEWALRAVEAWGGDVLVVTAGPAGAEVVLRDALAAGASRAVRVAVPSGASSRLVAAALAPVVADAGLVLCGDWSLDRGSGSVPAFLAHHLGAAQALGCTALHLNPDEAGVVRATRRLDGGRRELLVVRCPGIVSVEGATARLRRASLGGVLRARRATIEVLAPPAPGAEENGTLVGQSPYRPRARSLPAPSPELDARQRILALTGAQTERDPPQLLALDPPAAADRILDQLRTWGYRP